MKKLILGIILISSLQTILCMEEQEKQINILTELSKHHPALERNIIGEGIESALKSSLDPLEAVINAYKYINTITSIDRFWHSKKSELIEMLKDLAKEQFAHEYADLNEEGLNNKLNEVVIKLSRIFGYLNIDKIREKISENKSPERNEIVKLILAGADPNLLIVDTNGQAKERLLHKIINYEDDNLVWLLILYGADVNLKSPEGLRPLEQAVYGDYAYLGNIDIRKIERIIKLLTMHGADINEKNENGYNIAVDRAIRIAEYKQDVLLKILLEDGAKLNQNDIAEIKKMGSSRFESDGYFNIIELLEKYGYQM